LQLPKWVTLLLLLAAAAAQGGQFAKRFQGFAGRGGDGRRSDCAHLGSSARSQHNNLAETWLRSSFPWSQCNFSNLKSDRVARTRRK